MDADIVLQPELKEFLQLAAHEQHRSISDVLNEAIERYRAARELEKMELEMVAFKELHAALRQRYPDEWVAIYHQQLVDHDADGTALYRRVRAQYGQIAVLIQQVTETFVEDLWFRTPSTGRMPI